MDDSAESTGVERLDKTSSTVVDTDIPSWQKKVYDTRNTRPKPKWLRYFERSYNEYTEDVELGEDPARSIRNIGEALSLFLAECSNQGSDAKIDSQLLNETFCSSKLNKMDTCEFKTLLEMLKKVLGASVTDQAAWTDGVSALFNHELFLGQPAASSVSTTETPDEVKAQKRATMGAWKIRYEGELHKELWNHMVKLYESDLDKDFKYANMCAIIQSSGTGKSRMVDKLGMSHFVIPLCLREDGTTGFPPADPVVRSYLTESLKPKDQVTADSETKDQELDEDYARNRINAFLHSLFEATRAEVERIIREMDPNNSTESGMYEKVSEKFRLRMTEGQLYHQTNAFRKGFYQNVIKRAEQSLESAHPFLDPKGSGNALASELASLLPSFSSSPSSSSSLSPSPEKPTSKPKSKSKSKPKSMSKPELEPEPEPKSKPKPLTFVLAFDESAVLSERKESDGFPPLLTILRRQLRFLKGVPFFALFLATTGRVAPFLSRYGPDQSMRIESGKLVLSPAFSGCVFDALNSESVAFVEGEMTVRQAASEWTMMHLGRPLWATRVDKWTKESDENTSNAPPPTSQSSGRRLSEGQLHVANADAISMYYVRRDAMRFAVAKLLNRSSISEEWNLGDKEMMASLCHRLPIEFHSTATFQYQFVENHMRICVRLDPSDQSMVSMSSSEPVLSEAAFVAMMNCPKKILPAMQIFLSGFSVNKGDRGELVALLILLLARDKAVSEKNADIMWKSAKLRGVSSFSGHPPEELRHPAEPDLFEWNRVLTVPEFLRALFGEIEGIQGDIDLLFKDSRMHFNHFIKCFQQSVLRRRYLAGLLMRGAALLCANGQEAVDASIPFSMSEEISRFLISLILIQVKNNAVYGHKPVWGLFDNMEPCELGYIDDDSINLPPIVRIVFALASSKPSVTGRRTVVHTADGKSYVAVDIWCAGISPAVLPCVQKVWEPADTHSGWATLLDFSQGWNAPYTPPGEIRPRDFLRTMTPCMGEALPFWNFCPELTVLMKDKELRIFPAAMEMISSQIDFARASKRKVMSDSDEELSSDFETESEYGKRKSKGKGKGKAKGNEKGKGKGKEKAKGRGGRQGKGK